MSTLHYKTKESAVKKYGHLVEDPEALKKALAEDKNNYTDEELKDLLESFITPGSAEPKAGNTGTKPAKAPKATSPNDKIADKLKEFDYEELRGESFKKYCLLVQSLQLDQLYDFEQYQVEPIKKVRFRGVKDSPIDTIGFKIKNNKPINTTRIPVKYAISTNGKVVEHEDGWELISDQFGHNGRYFLLKR